MHPGALNWRVTCQASSVLRLGTGLSPLHLVGCGVSACTGVWEEHWFPL